MSQRPRHIDIGQPPSVFDRQRLGNPSPRNELPPSPRSGEVPPALSPLDAFALQGRLLASKFEEQDGRRISRLPPMTVANEFGKPRPNYFTRPFAYDDHTDPTQPTKPEPFGANPSLSGPTDKHTSFYPTIHGIDSLSGSALDTSYEKPALEPVSEERSPDLSSQAEFQTRTQSPEPVAPNESGDYPRSDFVPEPPRKTPTNESMQSSLSVGSSLIPPSRSPYVPPRSPRAQLYGRPSRVDSGDDSDALSFHSDPFDLTTYQRNPSLKSARERPRSPFSPTLHARRSPSISSEISNPDQQQAPRRSMNFSRPISPAMRMQKRTSTDSRPSFDQSTRILTADSPPVRPSTDGLSIQDSVHDLEGLTRLWTEENASNSLTDDEQSHHPPGASSSSYTYAKYALPRGRKVVSNGSFKAQSWLAHQFEWDHPTYDEPQRNNIQDSSTTPNAYPEEDFRLERQPTLPSIDGEPSSSLEPPSTAVHKPQASFNDYIDQLPTQLKAPERPDVIRSKSYDDGITRPIGQSRFHEEGIAQPLPTNPPPEPESKPSKRPAKSPSRSRANSSAAATETPTLRRKSEDKSRKSFDKKRGKDLHRDTHMATPDQVPAEEHLAKGIELHENGNVQKATYHLRIAARAGLPSAMLLYALACRHGWGMRPNQQEAVLWLRKAVDISRVEVDKDAPEHLLPPSFGGPQDKARQKQHKAQLALSIYELGVSYLNGWGIQQDKVLALRCFEIAAGWGDADALSEAGFCYAKGVGCKKDLAKAAGYYRQAERQGVSMAGNSWIYKEKYNPKEPPGDDERGRGIGKEDDKRKKTRDKSRTRTFFGGRKKTNELSGGVTRTPTT
ncbi:MAG: hypothetical protein Q9162_000793 [Coniocarpon cinnabarinum]